MKTIFYKMHLIPTESGLEVITDKWVSIHETPCFHFCVREHNARTFEMPCIQGETELQKAKRLHIRIRRIHKIGGRFAFDTEEKAMEHLKFLKRKQLVHMKRVTLFVESFLNADELKNVGSNLHPRMMVPNSGGLVNGVILFD